MSQNKLSHYIVICDKKKKKKYVELLSSHGGMGIDTIYGKGSAKAGDLAQALGLDVEEHKAVISCLIAREQAEALTDILCHEHDFHKKNTGFAFSIPVESLVI